MRRDGIQHAELSRLIGLLGHTDRVVVADCGLPLPRDLPVVDLALGRGHLGFQVVLDALLDEIVVQSHTVASESEGSAAADWFTQSADRMGERHEVTHEQFKKGLNSAAFAVRTGERTPYANVLLECGVPF
ncbi:D-ribose pyranase [Austwickia chelonae]|uniref:D-ribose pyranase n=1 Tax=Austwickia chelonae NBRC 105200 TaxID=1184607 RepID=K6UN16_9MICO|nr:D-ribose pyranase [Austwickia chelonae]GAB78606.1 D-ribose pyranase [Austwickia chelonae NBRC 105200]